MRFKAKLAQDQVQLLTSIIAPLSKLCRNSSNNNHAIVYFDREYVRISGKDENGITCFAELNNKMLFMDHRIESAANNVILCQIDLVSWKLALQSVTTGGSKRYASNGDNNNNNGSNNSGNHSSALLRRLNQPLLTMKLAKRNSLPCLCLEGNQHHYLDIYQAIPIRILRANEMKYHLPPAIPTPTVQLELPMSIRPVVDKLKQLGPCLYLQGSMKGDLTIRFDQEGKASVACFYNQLVPRWDDDGDEDRNGNDDISLSGTQTTLKVDSAKLATCLQWQQPSLPVSSCLLGMVPNEMLVLHVVLRPEDVGFFTYYVPVYYMDPEEELA